MSWQGCRASLRCAPPRPGRRPAPCRRFRPRPETGPRPRGPAPRRRRSAAPPCGQGRVCRRFPSARATVPDAPSSRPERAARPLPLSRRSARQARRTLAPRPRRDAVPGARHRGRDASAVYGPAPVRVRPRLVRPGPVWSRSCNSPWSAMSLASAGKPRQACVGALLSGGNEAPGACLPLGCHPRLDRGSIGNPGSGMARGAGLPFGRHPRLDRGSIGNLGGRKERQRSRQARSATASASSHSLWERMGPGSRLRLARGDGLRAWRRWRTTPKKTAAGPLDPPPC